MSAREYTFRSLALGVALIYIVLFILIATQTGYS